MGDVWSFKSHVRFARADHPYGFVTIGTLAVPQRGLTNRFASSVFALEFPACWAFDCIFVLGEGFSIVRICSLDLEFLAPVGPGVIVVSGFNMIQYCPVG